LSPTFVDLEMNGCNRDCKSLLLGVMTRQNSITRSSEMRVIKKRLMVLTRSLLRILLSCRTHQCSVRR